jgi:hypothetical protein
MIKVSKRRRLPARQPLFAALTTGMVLAHGALVLAQTVGPEIEVRDPSTSGSVFIVAAKFEPGAAYVAWEDTRNEDTTDIDVYVQKLGPDGTPAWTSNGFPVCVFSEQQYTPAVTPDGAGGCVVAWVDSRAVGARYIYAQRLSPAGDTLWTPDGLRISGTTSGEQYTPTLHQAPDGNLFFTYGEERSRLTVRSYWLVAQKIDGTGQRLWGANGVDTVEGVRYMRSLPDGSGGLVVFGQIRDDPGGFRFQRVLANQSLAWAKAVDLGASLSDFTVSFNFDTDGAGGVILAYLENRVVRTARVTGDGAIPWSESVTTLASTNVVITEPPVVASDGAGGAFVAWVTSFPHDVHVQHLDSNGTHLWPEGGAVVPDGSSFEREVAMVADGAGGVFLSFATATSLRGQRLDSSGAAQWKVNGTNGVSLMSGDQPIIGLGASGPIVVYARTSLGLSVRTIDVPQSTSFHLTNIVFLPNNQVSLTLSGGVPGSAYDILRATALGAPLTNASWTIVGTVQPGESWIDTSPPLPMAVYAAGKQTP